MKLIVVNKFGNNAYTFNSSDSEVIMARCKAAGKQWSDQLLGFLINTAEDNHYVAITVKAPDGSIESMEYVDIETDKPEFAVDKELLDYLASQSTTEIPLEQFSPILTEILASPLKARRWEVYPEISRHYPSEH